MRRGVSLFMALLCSIICLRAQDDAPVKHASVTAYLQTLLAEPVDTINLRVDRLIDSVGMRQPALQPKVAGLCFDFFTSSPVMGHEAVAVHIADEWFLNGKLKPENESILPLVRTFAEFNRNSLVGMPAPALTMEGIDGIPVEIRELQGTAKVLFFYDTECSTCRREAPLLADLARNYSGGQLTIVAIYTQGNREAWEAFASETFGGIDNPSVTFHHLWDPEAETGYHLKYGVISTPMMFLLDSQNTIVGRGLDCTALARMLDIRNAERLQYYNLFDQVFNSIDTLWYEDVEGIVDALAARTRENPKLYTELMEHLFDYLRSTTYHPKQRGAIYLAEKYIAREPEYWSPEFFERTVHALAMASLNPVDSPATQLTLQNRCGRNVKMLDHKHYYTVVFFHLLDCKECQAQLAQLEQLRADLWDIDVKVVLVYVGEQQQEWKEFVKKQLPSHWTYLNDFKHTSNMRALYDLETVPHLYLINKEGTVVAKDITPYDLQQLIPFL